MRFACAILLAVLLAPAVHAADPVRAAKPGLPLPGLTPAEVDAYKAGFLAFREHMGAGEGLGPNFNGGSRCYHCHRGPALGGTSKETVTRFGRTIAGGFDPLVALGGPVLQEKAVAPGCEEVVPPQANVVVRRSVSSTLGAGLVEAIPDEQRLDREMAQAAANPAMAGRVHVVTSVSDGLQHVGRFGWKATGALLADVVAEAMVNEMGVTNPLFPAESPPNGNVALLALCDPVPDPEDTGAFLDELTTLLRFLSPMPVPKRMQGIVQPGEVIFNAIGCGFCHYSGYTTVSANAAIDGKLVDLYSDLLLHDVGTGDGLADGNAQAAEFRTAPLWVLKSTAPFLHDGRARNIEGAILAHAGQATDVRAAYMALAKTERLAVLKFLGSR
ncbi:MAG TPA: di-heme oxidoredictase family protein [Candidatus Binatia bacterium]|nr:di-heme oxidoredictase family protein [Candidatus Binatia bacterium]